MIFNDLFVYCDWLEDQGEDATVLRLMLARRQANLSLRNSGDVYGNGYGDGYGNGNVYGNGYGDGYGDGDGERK